MIEPKIVKSHEAEAHDKHGQGKIFKLLYPEIAGTKNLFVGLAKVPVGEAPHVFHNHSREKIGERWLVYEDHFEEFYFVVSGAGTMQWKLSNGDIEETPVTAGDAIYMPPGVVEHRIFNSGSEELLVLYGGTPPAKLI